MTSLWTGLDSDDANALPADHDRALAEEAFRLCRTYTNRDRGVFVNFAADDEGAAGALAAAFTTPTRKLDLYRGGDFKLGDRTWMDARLPGRFYDAARPISLEQDAVRKSTRQKEVA